MVGKLRQSATPTNNPTINPTNARMFGDKPELHGEGTSLRCATRTHQCNGVNLADAPPGYPTRAGFEASFADCAAQTDACPNATDGTAATDTSGPTACSPLEDVHQLAQGSKALKADPENQIRVAGTFGWPRSGADGRDEGQDAVLGLSRLHVMAGMRLPSAV